MSDAKVSKSNTTTASLFGLGLTTSCETRLVVGFFVIFGDYW